MHIEGNLVTFKRANDAKQIKQNHGTTRANVHNAVVGVSEGYKRVLELRGIGYKAALKGTSIELWAGYSHTMTVEAMPGVKISILMPLTLLLKALISKLSVKLPL